MLKDALESLLDRIGPTLYPDRAPELFGPTDINAQTGNQRLCAALNRRGTVTVLRWPRPSFYNHVTYRTTDRDAPRFGAEPNQGVFFGLRLPEGDGRTTASGDGRTTASGDGRTTASGDGRTTASGDGGATASGGGQTTWLRDWEVEQRYVDDWSDAVGTTYRSRRFDLEVTVNDVVAPHEDALFRGVSVDAGPDADVSEASLLLVENLTASVSKGIERRTPNRFGEDETRDRARYDPEADALIHEKSGIDASTGCSERTALAAGFDRATRGHQVGADERGDDARGGRDGRSRAGRRRDAYADAQCGRLSGADAHAGRTTGALAVPLDLSSGGDSATACFVAAPTADRAVERLRASRGRDVAAVRREKREWFADYLDGAPMPATDDESVRAVARRALLTLVTNYDPESGAVVASIASQSPYAMDWPRDGAYVNRVLDELDLGEWVETRNRWYASLQRQRDGDLVPAGAWAMNYFGDGERGGPIPWEIDQTAYAVWTLWDHYRIAGDESYLRDVYPASGAVPTCS